MSWYKNIRNGIYALCIVVYIILMIVGVFYLDVEDGSFGVVLIVIAQVELVTFAVLALTVYFQERYWDLL